jgi:hypothetical protein
MSCTDHAWPATYLSLTSWLLPTETPWNSHLCPRTDFMDSLSSAQQIPKPHSMEKVLWLISVWPPLTYVTWLFSPGVLKFFWIFYTFALMFLLTFDLKTKQFLCCWMPLHAFTGSNPVQQGWLLWARRTKALKPEADRSRRIFLLSLQAASAGQHIPLLLNQLQQICILAICPIMDVS